VLIGDSMFDKDPTIIKKNGDFIIQWEKESMDYPVTVYSGLSPDKIKYSNPLATTNDFHVRISGLNGKSRHYFCLRTKNKDGQIIAERQLPFEGTKNFRDMGGYQSLNGRRVKWGLLYRSGRLSDLTEQDLKYFSVLNIGLICDFRRKEEQNKSPNRLPEENSTKTSNLTIGAGSAKSFMDKIKSGKTGSDDMMSMMEKIYRDFVHKHSAPYAEMFKYLLENGNCATLIHCTAGKDRTGFGAAIILSALGVDRETIFHDYLLTTRYFPIDLEIKRMAENHNMTNNKYLDAIRPAFEVHPEYLQAAFDEIEKKYETIENYLSMALGVTKEVCEELQERFLY
jgi:protein-tyrosine phosphatase